MKKNVFFFSLLSLFAVSYVQSSDLLRCCVTLFNGCGVICGPCCKDNGHDDCCKRLVFCKWSSGSEKTQYHKLSSRTGSAELTSTTPRGRKIMSPHNH